MRLKRPSRVARLANRRRTPGTPSVQPAAPCGSRSSCTLAPRRTGGLVITGTAITARFLHVTAYAHHGLKHTVFLTPLEPQVVRYLAGQLSLRGVTDDQLEELLSYRLRSDAKHQSDTPMNNAAD